MYHTCNVLGISPHLMIQTGRNVNMEPSFYDGDAFPPRCPQNNGRPYNNQAWRPRSDLQHITCLVALVPGIALETAFPTLEKGFKEAVTGTYETNAAVES